MLVRDGDRMIEFQTLGAVALRSEDARRDCRSVLAQPRRVALLAYLALARPRGPHARDSLLALLWPERSGDRARKSLNQALYFLRRHLGDDLFASEGDRIGLGSGAVWCDAVEFERHLEAGEGEEALEMYGGELLPGFFPAVGAEFERWLEGERARLHAAAVAAAVDLIGEHEARSEPLEAVHWIRRARELAPYDENLTLRHLELLASVGDRTGALREYAAFERRLAADLDLRPSARLGTLGQRLRDDDAWRQRLEDPARARSAVTAHTAPSRPAVGGSGDSPEISRTRARAESEPRRPTGSRRMVVAAGIALAGLAGSLVAIQLALPPGGPASPALDERRVLVVDFVNQTADPELSSLGRIAAEWIGQELAATGLVSVVPGDAVLRETRSLEGIAPGAGRQQKALELAEGSGARLLVTGSYFQRGDSLQFHGRVVDVLTGRLLRSVEGSPVVREAVLAGIEVLRRRLAGALATVVDPRFSAWADAASQPPSLEAYRLYADGLDAFFAEQPDEAFRLFLAAARRDSAFTAPLLWAIRVGVDWDRFPPVDSLLNVLQARRIGLPAWDLAALDYFAARRSGTWEEVREAAARLVAIAPGSEWLLWLAGANLYANRPREALAIHDRLDPDRGWLQEWPYHWKVRADARHRLGDYEGELAELSLWRNRLHGAALRVELRALAALGRLEVHEAVLEGALEGLDSGERALLLLGAADELRAHGEPERADALAERAADLARSPLAAATDPERRAGAADLLYRAGALEEARAAYLGTGRQNVDAVRVRLGRIAARLGEREEALRVDAWLASEPGRDSNGWRTMERAMIRALLGDREEALKLVRQSMREGHGHYPWLHAAPELEPLRGWAPFEELMRPKG